MRGSCFRRFGLFVLVGLLVAGIWLASVATDPRNQAFVRWSRGDSADKSDLIIEQREKCPGAPFILPTDGFIGLLFADPRGPYSQLNRHQGIDIFTDADPGIQPIYAAYDGYITRESTWVSTVIQRIEDPLNPGQQVWLYYTHMADENGNDYIIDEFDRGTYEVFVEQGTLIGYVGDYDGNVPSRIWTHLHFSIVKDNGNGAYLSEANIDNTIDPSPYLGIEVNYFENTSGVSGCAAPSTQ